MKKKLLALLLTAILTVTCLPIQALVGAEAAEETESIYSFATQDRGLMFYAFTGKTDNYDADADGSISYAESLAETEAVLQAGYVNTIFAAPGTTDESLAHFANVIALCKEYNCKFWLYDSKWNSSTESLDNYLKNKATAVSRIKSVEGAWDLFLGFSWDEPFLGGMTNAEFREMTKYLYTTYKKRIFPVLGSNVVNEELKTFSGLHTVEVPTAYGLEYITDIGWDNYAYDVRESKLDDPEQNARLASLSSALGVTLTTADDYYRYIHDQTMQKINHPVNAWFLPCAYNSGPWTGDGADEDYCVAHLNYFNNLLTSTTAQYENQRSGGIAVFTYDSDRFVGLVKHLPISVNGNLICTEEAYATKWNTLSDAIKALKTTFDNDTANEIYTGITSPYSYGLNGTASYAVMVPQCLSSVNTLYFQWTTTGPSLPLRHENGESFYVIDSSKTNLSTNVSTQFYTLGKPGVDSEIDLSKVTAIALRIKINDNSPEYQHTVSSFKVHLDATDNDSTTPNEPGSQNRDDTNTALWLDLNDASVTKMYPSNGYSSAVSYETTGSMNGYMIIPFELFSVSANSTQIRDYLKSIKIFFNETAATTDAKASTWENKEFLLGDCFFIENVDTFASACTQNIVKYSSGYDDGAYYAQKIPGYKSSYGAGYSGTMYIRPEFSKNKVAPETSASGGGYLHIATIAGGDRALELSANSGYLTSLSLDFRNYDTYEGYNVDGTYANATKGIPTSIKNLGIKGLAIRAAITGNENKTSYFTPTLSAGYYSLTKAGQKVTFIDYTTGEISEYTVSTFSGGGTGIAVTGNLDGYFVIPDLTATYWNGGAYAGSQSGFNGVGLKLYGDWSQGQKFYFGDSFWLTDIEKFKKAHTAPTFSVTADRDSITATTEDTNVVFSLDGKNWSTSGEFTDLVYYSEYTVYAKFNGGRIVLSQKVWTVEEGTVITDGAFYYYDVPTPDVNSHITMVEYEQTGTIRETFGKSSYGGDYAANSFLYVDRIGDEGMICFDADETTLGVCANQMLYINGFRDNTQTPVDIKNRVYTDGLTHMAMRVKVSGGTSGQLSSFGLIFQPLSFESNLSDAFLVDYETRQVIDPNWSGHGFTFTDEFDGWIVIPFTAYSGKTIGGEVLTAKDVILGLTENTPTTSNTASSFQFWFHNGCSSHGVTTESNWTNRVLHFGDVMILSNPELFSSYRTSCDNLGHELTFVKAVNATETESGNVAHYVCEHCGKTYSNAAGTTEIDPIIPPLA